MKYDDNIRNFVAVDAAPARPVEADDAAKAFGFASAVEDINLRELFRKLWRRRRIIIGTVMVITALVAVVVFQLTPQYTASTYIMIEPRQSQVVDIRAVLSGLPADNETVNSEIEIIKSRHLADRVVDKLQLDQDPEFNLGLRERSVLAAVVSWIRGLASSQSGTEASAADQAAFERAEVISSLLSHVTVVPKEESRVIRIDVDSEDPRKATQIANTIAELYLVDQLEAKFDATRRASQWLSQRLAELRQKVNIAEGAVEEYRQQAGLIKGKDDVSLASAQISELSSQLIVARTKRAEAEARLSQVDRLLKSKRGVGSAAEVLSSPLIQRLREKESEVIGRMAELSAEFGPKHPQMIAVRAEIGDLRAKIRAEVRKIIEGLRSEVEVAKARESSLQKSLKALEGQVGKLNRKDVELRALEREANASRALLETFLTRFKETSGQEEIQTPDARIVSAADVPTEPSFPRVTLILAMTIIGSGFLGVLIVFVVEQLDNGFRSMDQIEKMTGYPALGLIPTLESDKSMTFGSGEKGRLAPEDYILDRPVSAYAEALRNLHVSLALSDVDKPPKVILISSAVPKEGKSATALSLTRLVARSGQKVLLIDCDLRRPTAHKRLGLAERPGLVELLAQKADPAEVIQMDEPSGADVITAGEHAPNPTDLLASEQMKQAVGKFAEHYDLVVLDCSPVLAVADTRVLAGVADKVVFVAQWERTRRESSILALKQIADAHGSIAGVVLSQVNVKKHAGYDYSDSGYYYGEYRKYYSA